MKIALLSFEYPPETAFGGIGTYTWTQARALVKLGHEVHVLAGATRPTRLRSLEQEGVQVHRFHAGGPVLRTFNGLAKHGLAWTRTRVDNGLSMQRGLEEIARAHAFDVIEMPDCGAEGLLVNRRPPAPTLVQFHSPAQLIMGSYGASRLDRALCALLERIAIRGASGFSSASRFLADEVRAKLGVRAPVRVIPYGIDLDLFGTDERSDARARFDLPRDRPVILFAGRMEPRKGIHLCREIASTLLGRHRVAFVFAGEDPFGYMRGTLLPEVRSKARRGSIHYLGKLELAEVRACLRLADVFLIPSLWDNCPYACLEAMAASRAIVSSDAGGLPELIRDGENGLLARTEDVSSYVLALERLLEDAVLRERFGAAARRTVEERHADVRAAKQTVDHYREVLAGGPLAASA